MSYANNVTQKCQNAAAAYLIAATALAEPTLTLLPETSIFAGIGTASMGLPRAVCVCKRAEVEEPWDGNWSAELVISVYSSAHDTIEDEHHQLAGQVFSHFFLSKEDVGIALSDALDEFTAQFVIPVSQTWDTVADEKSAYWISTLTLTVKCCGSDIDMS